MGRHGSTWRCLVLRSLRTEHCLLTISVSLVSVLVPTLLVEMWPSVIYYPDICRMGVICLWTPHLVRDFACFCPATWPGVSPCTRDWPLPPAVKASSLNHWTAMEVPLSLRSQSQIACEIFCGPLILCTIEHPSMITKKAALISPIMESSLAQQGYCPCLASSSCMMP